MSRGEVIRQVGRLFEVGTLTGLTDGQLLDRFLVRRDEVAFETLVARHGPMVLGVCRAVLRDPADADDAFQAAFLVLVRQARTIRGRDGLGGWLYRTTYHIALRACAATVRRQRLHPPPAADPPADPAVELLQQERWDLVHDELNRLPEKYRAPVVLCDLEGLTHDEAAARLRWPVGTVKGRLFRAREQLRQRLTRRGVTAPAALLGVGLANGARAAVPATLLTTTARAGLAVGTGTALGMGLVSVQVATLVSGAIHMFWIKKLCLLVVGLAAIGGAGVFAWQAAEDPKPGDHPGAAASPAAAEKSDREAIQGEWLLVAVKRESEPRGVPRGVPPVGASLFKVTADKIITYEIKGGGFGDFEEVRMDYSLDPSTNPRSIDIWPRGDKGKPLHGVYSLHGDDLMLHFVSEGEDRPRDFQPTKGTSTSILRRKGAPPVKAVEIDTPGGDIKLAEPYRVKPGDVLDIGVHQEDKAVRPLTGERVVRPDGTISLGFYGDLPVAGLTRKEIKVKIIEHLRKYLNKDVLGLVKRDKIGKLVPVVPEDSDRVFVDESPNFRPRREDATTSKDARLDAIEAKLDAILKRLDERGKR